MGQLSTKEVKEWLSQSKVKPTYKMRGHNWVHDSSVGKSVCQYCGLVALNNPLTDWCIRQGCYSDIHPQYANKVKQFTRSVKL